MSKNDITGDEIKTKVNSDKFRENFDRIFGKPKEVKHESAKSSPDKGR